MSAQHGDGVPVFKGTVSVEHIRFHEWLGSALAATGRLAPTLGGPRRRNAGYALSAVNAIDPAEIWVVL